MCARVGFVMCGCVYIWALSHVGVLVIYVLVCNVFYTVCTVLLYCFVYAYLFLFVSSVPV